MNLSIIIPCYNSEKTLQQAVNSCYRQKLADSEFEIVLVDDGSLDETRSLIRNIALDHGNIRCLFNTQNLGGGAARNKAVMHSNGRIIFCLDSDDILPDGTLSQMYEYLQKKNCDGVTIHHSIKFVGNDITNIDHIDTSPYPDREVPFESLVKDEFCPLDVNFMYTRKAFDLIGGYPTRHGFDTQGFAWRFASAGLCAYSCPGADYLHRIDFGESYYLREYNNGSVNYNWRDIFLEHYYVFSQKALLFIQTFDHADFTRNLMGELRNIDSILLPDYKSMLGRQHPPLNNQVGKSSIARNSLKGYIYRIRHGLRNLLHLSL